MNMLHEKFLTTCKVIGLPEILHPVFYNAEAGIRFEIGGNEEVYLNDDVVNPRYILNAFERSKKIYDKVFNPDILRIDIFDGENQFLKKLNLPVPKEIKSEEIIQGTEKYGQEYCYWDLTEQKVDINQLLLEIIKGDIGGLDELVDTVYFVDSKNAVMYHLYDDRGLDVVAKERETLLSVYNEFNSWILDHDREEIDKVFGK